MGDDAPSANHLIGSVLIDDRLDPEPILRPDLDTERVRIVAPGPEHEQVSVRPVERTDTLVAGVVAPVKSSQP